MQDKKSKSEWIRQEPPKIPFPFYKPIDEALCWINGKYQTGVQLQQMGECQFGQMTHIVLKKVDIEALIRDFNEAYQNSLEPGYSEKVQIIKKVITQRETVAMEVFPAQTKVVDVANLYHIWICEKSKFPFDVMKATTLPEGKEWEHEIIEGLDIQYMARTAKTPFGKAGYLYLKRTDGKELRWKEKQLLKNELQYDEITAVEVISKHGVDKTTCLICLPLGYSLDFGLRP